ncbi:MAG: type pilus assembly protein PilB, partial [Solirubrobacteraceae bacterium]|nr:type pilus assembly protein PilB [Solirubrobacteraceae bacterium]
RIEPVVVSPEDLDALLGRANRIGEDAPAPTTVPAVAAPAPGPQPDAGEDPAIDLLRSIVSDAIEAGATDVHVDPNGSGLLVRHRVDGLMTDAAHIHSSDAGRVISQIKILSDLDIAVRHLPQDGRASLTIDGHQIDVRVSTVPLVDGESAVLHLLDPGRRPLTLAELGMSDCDRARVERSLWRSRGAILVAAAAGAGATTTLHAALAVAGARSKTVMTIEDPVEYRLPGIKQIQVRERAGLSFATGLRAIVGADPDVILAGALRDAESARIAIDAALTGHLVLSALHADDAPAAAARLVDMGVEPYLVAAGLDCVLAQRLARRLCAHCRRAVSVPAADAGLATGGEVEIFESVGCDRCGGTGFRGRVALFQVMTVGEEISALVVARAPASEIRRAAVAAGMRTLIEDGLAKVRAGETTLAEAIRVTA